MPERLDYYIPMDAAIRTKVPRVSRPQKFYVASKVRHADYWQKLRASGVNIISTWIDEAGKGQTFDVAELASRCINEIKKCDALILLVYADETVQGALIEVGVAMAYNKPIYCVARLNRFSIFDHHPLWTRFNCIGEIPNLRAKVKGGSK